MAALYSFRDCLDSEVNTQEIVVGSILITRDTGDMYYDNPEGIRVTLGKTVHIVNGTLDTELFPDEGHLYYSATDKIVAFYHNGKMEPVNLSFYGYRKPVHIEAAGTTEVTVSSDGNLGGLGTIMKAVPFSVECMPSIADLESEFTDKVTTTVDMTTGCKITVANTAEMQFHGYINVVLLLIPNYTK